MGFIQLGLTDSVGGDFGREAKERSFMRRRFDLGVVLGER